jgi:hypothetical protein
MKGILPYSSLLYGTGIRLMIDGKYFAEIVDKCRK